MVSFTFDTYCIVEKILVCFIDKFRDLGDINLVEPILYVQIGGVKFVGYIPNCQIKIHAI